VVATCPEDYNGITETLAAQPDVLSQAEKIALNKWQQRPIPWSRGFPWGRFLFCTGLALVVFYLMWKASEDTNWQSKRSINPYKLVGGIIGELG
jgi:type VI protein secretion system component VasF